MSTSTLAVVTGAARGIGYAFAEQLAAHVADQASHRAVAAEACRQGDLDAAGIDIRARALCPDVVDTEMVSS